MDRVILFDGVCNLCSGTVQFFITKDKKNLYKFASLQSEIGQQLLKQNHLPLKNFGSFVLIMDGKVYLKSTAALLIMSSFGSLWWTAKCLLIIPKRLRDYVYTIIAKNRYNWFGKKESCWIPSPDLKAKFL